MNRLLLSTLVLVSVSTFALAQRQPGGNRGGAGNRANTTSLLPQVLNNKDLQADLKVTDDQKSKFKDVATKQADIQKQQRELFTGGGQPDRTKMTEIRTEMTKVNEEATKVLNDTLTAEQKSRLKQIEVQQLGLRAFTNAEVVKELKITDEQKAKIKEITDAVQKELTDAGIGGRPMGGRGQGGNQPNAAAQAENRKKRTEINEKAIEKVTAELTDDQKKTLKTLTGEKFDLTKLSGFGGRGAPMQNNQ